MSDVLGIKETKEAAIGIIALGGFIAKEIKAKKSIGQDMMDLFVAMQSDPEFRSKLEAAVNGLELVPSEIGNMSIQEGIELAGAIVPEVIKALK